jgi:hypothetical protein
MMRKAENAIPFLRLSSNARKRMFVVALALTLGIAVVLAVIGRPLTTSEAPNGIVSFEFAGSAANAQRILDSWGQIAVWAAVRQTWIDFLYIPAYALTLALACGLSVFRWNKRGRGWAWLGVALAWGAFAAGALDIVENVAMLIQLNSGANDSLASLARNCAIPKFVLILFSMIYALFGGALAMTDRFVGEAKKIMRVWSDNANSKNANGG